MLYQHRFLYTFVIGFLGAVLSTSTSVFADFDTINGWNGYLFSSYLVATATMKHPDEATDDAEPASVLGDQHGLLGVSIEADEDDQVVTVTITCDSLMEPSVFSCTLPEAGETYLVKPKIKFKYDALAKRTQTGPISVTYSVKVGDEEVEEKSDVITLCSINDCPFSLAIEGKWTSIRYMFAAYVNEQHPFVDKILREALDFEIVDSFTGYQTKGKADVFRQTYAVWHALSKRNVRYSSITKCAAICETVGSQHIRLLDESINNAQANCVDGSALIASMLRKIGIEPMLVHVPGHCYLAFYLDGEGKEFVGLETTMIGSVIEDDAVDVEALEDVVDEEWQSENSWKTFAAAIAHGSANLKKFEKEFKDPGNQNYKLISVAVARRSGILPIRFQSDAKLAAAPVEAEEDDGDDE